MYQGSIICQRCGWQGQMGDRICGRCGQPLNLSNPLFGTQPDYTPTVESPAPLAPPPLSPDFPSGVLPGSTQTASVAQPSNFQGNSGYQGYAGYTGVAPTVASTTRVARPYIAAASGATPSRGLGCMARSLLALVIAGVLLVVLLACGWSAIIRPALHTAFDQRLRTSMDAAVDKVPILPPGFPLVTQTITEREFNQQANTSSNNGDLKNVVFHFQPGVAIMDYQLWERPGAIKTHLVARNGRLFAQHTQVTGWLTQVENGSELQDALNESLSRIPAQDYVQSVAIGDGTLTVTLRRA